MTNNIPNIFAAIEAQLPVLPYKLRVLALYVLDNREKVAFQTVRQLAASAKISETTIMRFVAHLGFTGYSDFLNQVRDFLAAKLTGSDEPQTDGRPLHPLESLAEDLRNHPVFLELAGLVSAVRQILILASPDAAGDGARLKWLLARRRPDVTLGADSLRRAEEELAALPEDSLVIILTGRHSTLELRHQAEEVKAKKLPLFLFTGHQASALAEFTDHHIVLPDSSYDLALPLAVNLLAELAEASLAQRFQDYQDRMDRIALKHQPLPERRDTLQLAVGHEIRSLDPANIHNLMWDAILMHCVFQGLVKFREGSWELVPELAESWETSADGRTVIFYLRRGVQFHNGYGEFSAQDVKFSFERMATAEVLSRQPAWESLEEVVVLSRYVVKLVFRRPCPHLFTSILPFSVGLIVSRRAMEQMGASQFSTKPVGTGPYAVTAFQPRNYMEMQAFPQFRGLRPQISRLIFRLDAHAFNFPYHFQKSRLDLAVLPNVNPEVIRDAPGLLVERRLARQVWWLGMMMDKPPFDRPAARQAVRLALDRKRIAAAGLQGTAPLDTLIPVGVPGHWAEAPRFPYTPDQARRLMADAGVKPGQKISLAANSSEIDLAALEIIRANLADIGFSVHFELSNRHRFIERLHQRQCDMYVYFYNVHPDAYLSLRLFTKGQFCNLSGWDNPAFDELVGRIGSEADEQKRLEMTVEAQKMIADDAWGVWLGQGLNSIMFRPFVDIGQPWPDGFLTPWTMSKKLSGPAAPHRL